eukprot:bmy_05518T0
MQEEETYTSLQWDNPAPNPYQKHLSSTKNSGNQFYLFRPRPCGLWVFFFSCSVMSPRNMVSCDSGFMYLLHRLMSNLHFLGCQVVPGVHYCNEAARKTHPTGQSTAQLHTMEEKPCPPDEILPNVDAEVFQFSSQILITSVESKYHTLYFMDFITGSLRKIKRNYDHWVGLSQDGSSQPWLWQDGLSPSPD